MKNEKFRRLLITAGFILFLVFPYLIIFEVSKILNFLWLLIWSIFSILGLFAAFEEIFKK